MTWLTLAFIPWLPRLLLVILFPFSTLDKIFNYRGAVRQARSSFLPDGPALLVVAGLVEVTCSACILLAWHDRLAAFMLAGYCVVTALLFHTFWSHGDFWVSGDSKGRTEFWDFLKNLGLAGGLGLLLMTGALLPLSTLARNPLSSAPVAPLTDAVSTILIQPGDGEPLVLPGH